MEYICESIYDSPINLEETNRCQHTTYQCWKRFD